MKKVFLCQVPMQKPESAYYEAVDNRNLSFDEAFAYPLLLLLKAYAGSDDEVRIVLTHNGSDNDLEQIENLREEIVDLQSTLKFKGDLHSNSDFIALCVDYRHGIRYQMDLFLAILPAIKGAEEIYADISFGTKPTPIIVAKLLDYVRKTRATKLGHITYANIDFSAQVLEDGTRRGYIYDVTPLYALSAQIDLIALTRMKDPDSYLEKLLSFDNTLPSNSEDA